jgi:acetyltransferase-like isoleucine patch superfamily enzyme
VSAFLDENGILLYMLRKKNSWKSRIFNFFISKKLGGVKNLSIHPSAQLAGLSHFSIGRNFLAGEHLRMEAICRYGKSSFNPKIIIKDNVAMNDFVHIAAVNYVEIGNNVLMASKIYISDHNHGNYNGMNQSDPESTPGSREIEGSKSVIIGDNVWIGEFVSILPGVTIGKGSIIGANSVVSRDIPPYSIAIGTPARIIKQYDGNMKKWVPVPKANCND